MFDQRLLSCISGNNNFTQGEKWIAKEDLEDLVYLLIPYGTTFLFIIISNLMLIYGFHKASRPFTIVTKLFIYLSIVDIVLGSTIFSYCFQLFFNIDFPCFVKLAHILMMQFSYFLGICIFGTISFLRYWSIRKPLHAVGIRSILIILAIEIVICALLASSVFLVAKLKGYQGIMITLFKLTPVTNLIATLFIVCVNVLSYKNLKSSKNDSVLSEKVENIQRRKRNSKALSCLLIITAFYVICLLPIITTIIVEVEEERFTIYLMMVAQLLYFSNSGINSMIVICRTKKLRIFYRMKCCSKIYEISNTTQERRIELN